MKTTILLLFGEKLPAIPTGYNYDFINAHALINLLQVRNGKLFTPSGMSYSVLVLDSNSRQMTLKVLRKISALVKNGAVILGPQPTGSPSLMDNKREYETIVNALWGTNGKVRKNQTLQEVLGELNIKPDFVYTKFQNDSEIRFVHRTSSDAEIYWVNNRTARKENTTASFRVSGKEPELWNPETGEIRKLSYSFSKGITTIPLQLEPADAFLLFLEKIQRKPIQQLLKK